MIQNQQLLVNKHGNTGRVAMSILLAWIFWL